MAPKRRRARGEGAVFKRASDGLWVGTLDLGVVDGRRRRKAVYGQSEREVIQKLSTIRTAHDRGIDLLAPALTVGQWLDVWLSDIKGFDGTRPRTLTLYEGLADRYVRACPDTQVGCSWCDWLCRARRRLMMMIIDQ
jgi:hypothetical protein